MVQTDLQHIKNVLVVVPGLTELKYMIPNGVILPWVLFLRRRARVMVIFWEKTRAAVFSLLMTGFAIALWALALRSVHSLRIVTFILRRLQRTHFGTPARPLGLGT